MVTMMNEMTYFGNLNRCGLIPLLIDPAYIQLDSRNSVSRTPKKNKIHNRRQFLELAELERQVNETGNRSRFLELVELEIDGVAGKHKQRGLRELDEAGILTLELAERHKGKKRMSALYQVLTTLPENDYREFKSLDSFYYYLPDNKTLASVKGLPIGVTYIYLSAQLEDLSGDWIRYAVAHEFAHAKMGHLNGGYLQKSQESIEREADLKAAQWGYKRPQ